MSLKSFIIICVFLIITTIVFYISYTLINHIFYMSKLFEKLIFLNVEMVMSWALNVCSSFIALVFILLFYATMLDCLIKLANK